MLETKRQRSKDGIPGCLIYFGEMYASTRGFESVEITPTAYLRNLNASGVDHMIWRKDRLGIARPRVNVFANVSITITQHNGMSDAPDAAMASRDIEDESERCC